MPAIVVSTSAATSTSRKFTWMPGCVSAKPDTNTCQPSPLPTSEKKPEPSQPIVYAPIA